MKTKAVILCLCALCALLSACSVDAARSTRRLEQAGGCPYGWNVLAWLRCSTPTHSCTPDEVCRRCTYEDPAAGAAFWFGSPMTPCFPGATLASSICLDGCGRESFFCRLRCL